MTVQGTPFAQVEGLYESWLTPARRTSSFFQENKILPGIDKRMEKFIGPTTEVPTSGRTETIVTEDEAATLGQSTCNTEVSFLLLAPIF